jgi:hypothetical protein
LAIKDGLTHVAGGIIILTSKPFVIGDKIEFPNDNASGYVTDIGPILRSCAPPKAARSIFQTAASSPEPSSITPAWASAESARPSRSATTMIQKGRADRHRHLCHPSEDRSGAEAFLPGQ